MLYYKCFITVTLFLLFPTLAKSQFQQVDKISKNIVQINSADISGSGVVYFQGDRLLVLTNRHVVLDNYEFDINVLYDVNEPARPAFEAELLAFSSEYDIAILEIKRKTNKDVVGGLKQIRRNTDETSS